MKLRSGEAAVLFVRRSEGEPSNYFVAVRKSESSFDVGSNDFRLDCGQETLLEIPQGAELKAAIHKAFSKLEEIEP